MSKNNIPIFCVWPLYSPLVENEMVVSNIPVSGTNETGFDSLIPVKAFTIASKVNFYESCPKGSDNPPIELIITDNQNPPQKHQLDTDHPKIDITEVPAGDEHAGLIGKILVDYNFKCLYFGDGSYLTKPKKEQGDHHQLQGVALSDWSGKGAPNPSPNLHFSWKKYPPLIENTMKISNVYLKDPNHKPVLALTIQTRIKYHKKIDQPPIKVVVKDHDGKPVYNGELNPDNISTDKIEIPCGDIYAGLCCKISVNYDKGCVFFDNVDDRHPAVLLKPEKENSPTATDYPLRFVKIFDWLGQYIP